jgi:hypothetical protein
MNMSAMTTNQCGRLIGYTCAELSAYTWEGVNALPYGASRVFAAAENAAQARKTKLSRAQASIEQIKIVSYSALGTAINNLEKAVDGLLAEL